MPSPDNQRFDAMLRRELKSDASAPRADCPGPDQLAALWERSLSRPERALVEAHLAGCARCQTAMAAMARADSDRAAAHAPGLWIRMAAPAAVLAVVVIMIGINLFSTPIHQRREQIAMALRHRLHRGHEPAVFTPAPPPSATSAAALAQRNPAAPQAQPQQLARAENELETRAAAKSEEPAHERRELAMNEPARAAPAQPANPPAPAASLSHEINREKVAPPAASTSAPAAAMSQPSPSAPPQMAKSLASRTTALPPVAPAGAVQNPAAAPASAPSTPAAVPSAESGVAQDYVAGAPAPQMLHRQAESGVASTQAGGMAAQPGAVGGMMVGRPPSVPTGLRPGFVSFQSPPPDVVAWNIGADGLIQRLRNGEWQTLHSGTSVDLLSGSAPSGRVCWIAGKDGTLLRTIDGGDHWEPITPPAAVELTKVEASSADSATVTTADARRFTTTDSGQDWTEDTQ